MRHCLVRARRWWSRIRIDDDKPHSSVEVNELLGLALRSCAATRDLECGRRIHSSLAIQGLSDIAIANSLLRMYGRCGSMGDAWQVFDRMPRHSTVSWNAIILSCVENEEARFAMEIFFRMEDEWCSSRTYVAVLMACSRVVEECDDGIHRARCLELGKIIHSKASRDKLLRETFVGNAVMEMYAKCGSMDDAWQVFWEMETDSRDVVSWTILMLGYVRSGEPLLALQVFERMKTYCCEPDSRAYVAALSACSNLADREEAVVQVDGKSLKLRSLGKGREIHSQLGTRYRRKEETDIRNEEEVYLSGCLVDMYCRCGALADAQVAFDRTRSEQRNVVLWTGLIQGYADNGESETALRLFWNMKAIPNSRTFIAAMAACASLGAKEQGRLVSGKLVKLKSLEKGMRVHAQALQTGVSIDIFVANTLIDLYTKCGSLPDARRAFDRLAHHSVVSWTALILGCAENGENELALELFRRVSCPINALTCAAAINACANMGSFQAGRKIHEETKALGFNTSELPLANSLVNLYSKCGCMADSEEVFGSMTRKDIVTWSSLISGYSGKGATKDVFSGFESLLLEGLDPDSVTYLSVLTACSHAGLVNKAREYFQDMRIRPEIEHYHCLIDALGRANLLDEAVELANERMPWEATAVTWTTILSSCRKWKNVAVAKQAFEAVMKLDRNEGAAYVLMASIFESLELFEEQRIVLAMAKLEL